MTADPVGDPGGRRALGDDRTDRPGAPVTVAPWWFPGPWTCPGAPGAVLRGGAVLAVARLVDLVGALARPLAAGTSAVPGGAELVGHLRP